MRTCVFFLVALLSCSDKASVNPVPAAAWGTNEDGTDFQANQGGSGSVGSTDPKPVRRTIFTTNPLGTRSDNMLVDGDFELSTGLHSGQFGWMAASETEIVGFDVETGGLCNSGLRCAVLKPKVVLLGQGVAEADESHEVSISAKVPSGKECDIVGVYLYDCDSYELTTHLVSESEPRANGWCEYSAQTVAGRSGLCVYVDSNLTGDQTALIDSALVVKAPEAASKKGEAWMPRANEVEKLRRAGERMRKRIRFDAGRLPVASQRVE